MLEQAGKRIKRRHCLRRQGCEDATIFDIVAGTDDVVVETDGDGVVVEEGIWDCKGVFETDTTSEGPNDA